MKLAFEIYHNRLDEVLPGGCNVSGAITYISSSLRESVLFDGCELEILRYAQDDRQKVCHPERSEGSLEDV